MRKGYGIEKHMREKILKRIICCICAAVMVSGSLPFERQAAGRLEAQAAGREYAANSAADISTEEVPAAPQNLREENGYIVWDEVKDAYGYTLKVSSGSNEWDFTYYVNSVELDRLCYENNMDFGEYKFKVCAFDEAKNSSGWSNEITAKYEPALDAPANVRVDENEKAFVLWDEVAGAVRYNIRIFRDDDERTLYRTLETEYVGYGCLWGYDPTGNYWISVQAVDRDYNVSEWTQPVMLTYTKNEIEKLKAPQNVRFDESGENILWDAVEGAAYYYVEMRYWIKTATQSAESESKYVRCDQTQLVNWKSYVNLLRTTNDQSMPNAIYVEAYGSDLEYSDASKLEMISYELVRDESIELPEELIIKNENDRAVLQWNAADNAKAYRIFFTKYVYNENEWYNSTAAVEQQGYMVGEYSEESLNYYIEDTPEGTYHVELYVADENGNYNSKAYSVTLNTPHDEAVWVPEVFYKFDELLWDYDRLRHDNTRGFWIRIINAKDGTIVKRQEQWFENYNGIIYLPNGKYIFEVCVNENGDYDDETGYLYKKLGPWSKPLTILKHDGGLFDEENKSTEEITAPPEAADIPAEDRITSITINPAFNMKHKDGNDVELDLTKIKIKANEIYDEDGLKRAEEALGEEIKGNKHYNLLDLTLLYDGKDFSNGYDGLVQVIIPLPAGHRDKTFSCYRLTQVDGKTVKEKIPGEQTEDSYIIYLEHFSEYALVAAGEEEAHTHVYGADWKNDENNHWKECDCGEKSENAAHTYGEWLTTKEATETEEGLKERGCLVCGYKESEKIAKLIPAAPSEPDTSVDSGNEETTAGESQNPADEPNNQNKTEEAEPSDTSNSVVNNTDINNSVSNVNNGADNGAAFTENTGRIDNSADASASKESISAVTGDVAAEKTVLLSMMSIISMGVLLVLTCKKKKI